MKTKKQKAQEMPELRRRIELLENDLLFVQSKYAYELIKEEVKRLKEIAERHQAHIDDPYVNRRRY
jgi:hypothetical protein